MSTGIMLTTGIVLDYLPEHEYAIWSATGKDNLVPVLEDTVKQDLW